MIKILCDRCGAEIKPGKIGYVALNFRETPDGTLMADNPYEAAHFCPVCMEGIADYIFNSPKRKKVEAPTKEERGGAKPTVKKRRRIDYGKIMALHNAGWNNARIADEMRMTKAAVSTALSTYKKKTREGKNNVTNTE